MGARGTAGSILGPLALVLWACSCSSSASAPAPAPSPATVSVPVSVNGQPAQPLTLQVDGEGFTPSILSAIPAPEQGAWASLEIDGQGTAKLLIALAHYPNAEPVLHSDALTGLVRAGLRSKKTGALMQGFVTEAPRIVAVYDQGHLQTGDAAWGSPLAIADPGAHTNYELEAAGLKELAKYDASGGKGKNRWWRLGDALHTLAIEPGSHQVLVVHYRGPGDVDQTLDVPVDVLQSNPEAALLKQNRRGQWKLACALPKLDKRTVVATSIEIRDASAPASASPPRH